MKIGLFGGTFDPIHLGHLILAETASDQLGLDEVWFIPARISPHKQEQIPTSPKQRLEMVELAIAGNAQFRVRDLELKRSEPSYTITTLEQIKQEHSQDELFLLIGGDSLADLPTWKDPQRILELVQVVALNRGDQPLDVETVLQQLGDQWRPRISVISMPPIGISATDLRRRCSAGKSIRYQVPRAVELYIQEHRLYQ